MKPPNTLNFPVTFLLQFKTSFIFIFKYRSVFPFVVYVFVAVQIFFIDFFLIF